MEPFKDFLYYFMMVITIAFAVGATAWVIVVENRAKERRRKTQITIAKAKLLAKADRRFNPNAEFCPYCLTNDYFYRGGGSWSPDRCPYHMNSDDFILWKQMNLSQRNKAANRFQRMWHDMHGTEYRFTIYPDTSHGG